MKKIIIIPARYKSSRFPGKPLVKLMGEESILHTYRSAMAVRGIHAVHIATDDKRIRDVLKAHGASVIMTSSSCRNGTERVAEAAKILRLRESDLVVNLQGDAPLTPPWFVEAIFRSLEKIKDADVVTPVLRCDRESYERFKNDRRHNRVGATTALFDRRNRALYFSKEVIPYLPSVESLTTTAVFHHVGVYGYRMKPLLAYPKWKIGPLEQAEQLEQLRFLENGKSVFVTEVDARGVQFWELNNPEDVAILERMMRANSKIKIRKTK